MTPESVGLSRSTLVLGKHSGRAAFRQKLVEMGYGDLGDNAVNDAFARFKELADIKKEIFDEDIAAIIDDTAMRAHDRIRLTSLEVRCGTVYRPPHAAMELEIDGQTARMDATGDGPVDCDLQGDQGVGAHDVVLELYQCRGDQGHRRPGRGHGAPARERQIGERPGVGHRHHGRLGQGLSARPEQAAGEAGTTDSGRHDDLTERGVLPGSRKCR
jgi:hypothetical protein